MPALRFALIGILALFLFRLPNEAYAQTIVFQVRDEMLPLEGAKIEAQWAGQTSFVQLGSTDSVGRLQATLPTLSEAQRRGFVTYRIQKLPDHPEQRHNRRASEMLVEVQLPRKNATIVECSPTVELMRRRSQDGRLIGFLPFLLPDDQQERAVVERLNSRMDAHLGFNIAPQLERLGARAVSVEAFRDVDIPPSAIERLRRLGCDLNALGLVTGRADLVREGSDQFIDIQSLFILPANSRLSPTVVEFSEKVPSADATRRIRLGPEWLYQTIAALAERDAREARTQEDRLRISSYLRRTVSTASERHAEWRQLLLELDARILAGGVP